MKSRRRKYIKKTRRKGKRRKHLLIKKKYYGRKKVRLYQFMVIKYLSGLEGGGFIFHGKRLKKIYPVKHIMVNFIILAKKLNIQHDAVLGEDRKGGFLEH